MNLMFGCGRRRRGLVPFRVWPERWAPRCWSLPRSRCYGRSSRVEMIRGFPGTSVDCWRPNRPARPEARRIDRRKLAKGARPGEFEPAGRARRGVGFVGRQHEHQGLPSPGLHASEHNRRASQGRDEGRVRSQEQRLSAVRILPGSRWTLECVREGQLTHRAGLARLPVGRTPGVYTHWRRMSLLRGRGGGAEFDAIDQSAAPCSRSGGALVCTRCSGRRSEKRRRAGAERAQCEPADVRRA